MDSPRHAPVRPENPLDDASGSFHCAPVWNADRVLRRVVRHGLAGLVTTSAINFAAITATLQHSTYAQQAGDTLIAASNDSKRTIVVYNQNDPDSIQLARFYAEQRRISLTHLVALDCATSEEITRPVYDRTIAEPLRQVFIKRGWWVIDGAANRSTPKVGASEIQFVALIRGVPLRIAPTLAYEGDVAVGPEAVSRRNESSVDSELADLGSFSKTISGIVKNPYYGSHLPIVAAKQPGLLLVCRLDAPTPDIVRRMIIDSLAAERDGLRGLTYVDARGTNDVGLKEGDRWLLNIASESARRGNQVTLDRHEELFATGELMPDAALYFGWYAETISGALARPDFKFVRGGIAVHIHSYSAVSLRDSKRYWCGPLLAAGAAATIGNVAEPYLSLTPNLDIFFDRLSSGFTFAESAWMSERALSWMTTAIGDPLYRPFRPMSAPSALAVPYIPDK